MAQVDDRQLHKQVGNRALTADELARVGVQRLNAHDLALACLMCGTVWTPLRWPDGRCRPFQWRCPNRCNW
jgi:hypothetical protein